jgi:hypothetical protein
MENTHWTQYMPEYVEWLAGNIYIRGAAPSLAAAEAMIKKSALEPFDTNKVVLHWARQYKAAVDKGSTSEQAAEESNAWLLNDVRSNKGYPWAADWNDEKGQ